MNTKAWRHRKAAFNQIHDLAPMSSKSGICISLAEFPAFIETETAAFQRFVECAAGVEPSVGVL
jgi:hypothetical protein